MLFNQRKFPRLLTCSRLPLGCFVPLLTSTWLRLIFGTAAHGRAPGAGSTGAANTLSKGLWKSVYLSEVPAATVAITHLTPHTRYRGEYVARFGNIVLILSRVVCGFLLPSWHRSHRGASRCS